MENVIQAQLGKAVGELNLKENELEWTASSTKLCIHVNMILSMRLSVVFPLSHCVEHMVAVKGDVFLLKIDLVTNRSHVFSFKNLATRGMRELLKK
jgi:hypothetical protein